MKKYYRIIAVVSLLAFAVAAFAACGVGSDADAKTVTLLFKNGDVVEMQTVDIEKLGLTLTDKTTVNDLLSLLKEKEGLDYTIDDGFIYGIKNLKPDSEKHEYICVMSTIGDDGVKDISVYAETQTINGFTVYTTAVGINKIPIRDGAAYAFVMKKW